MALDRSTIVRHGFRKETVPVESLGGELILRQLTLSEMLGLAKRTQEGGTQDDEIAQVLTWCAIDGEGKALMTFDEWQAWGAGHLRDAISLYEVVIRLTGLEKKTTETA